MTRERRPARSRRDSFDEWHPVVVRYTGLVLTVVLVVFTILGHGVELAPGYVAAAGLLVYKWVHDAAKGGE